MKHYIFAYDCDLHFVEFVCQYFRLLYLVVLTAPPTQSLKRAANLLLWETAVYVCLETNLVESQACSVRI